jgi:hypothetical protein
MAAHFNLGTVLKEAGGDKNALKVSHTSLFMLHISVLAL